MLLGKALISLIRLMRDNLKQREGYLYVIAKVVIRLTNVKTYAILCIVLAGCSQQPQLPLTQKVYIPTKCIATIPPPPRLTDDVVGSVILLQRSYLELRLLLKECISTGGQNAKK